MKIKKQKLFSKQFSKMKLYVRYLIRTLTYSECHSKYYTFYHKVPGDGHYVMPYVTKEEAMVNQPVRISLRLPIKQKNLCRKDIHISPCALFESKNVCAKSLEALSVQQSIYRLGDPNVSLTSPVIFRDNYVLSYDERMRNPKWVFEKITKRDLDGEADRKGKCVGVGFVQHSDS